MKSPLEFLYRLTEMLAGAALIGMGAVVLVDVVLRQFGQQLRGAADFSGYGLVALLFLGLTAAYRRGEHVRVGLVVDRITGRPRRIVETVLLAVALTGVCWATWWSALLVWDSWRFGELSPSLVAVPIWIPQAAMPIGLGVFAVSLLEDLVVALRGGTPSHMANAPIPSDEAPTFER